MAVPKKKLLLIDSFALLFRAYAAMPPLEFNGKQVGAVYGFFTILARFLADVKPTHVVAAFDRAEKTFRKERHEDYKAQREKAPDDFFEQVAMVKEALAALHVTELSAAGYEADDVIATLARRHAGPDCEVVVLTGDKDLLQLLSAHVGVLTPKIGFGADTLYSPASFREKYGFSHEHWIDYKALRGDPSDNLPGAPGIGEKIATELVKEFGGVEKMYAAIDAGKFDGKPRIAKILIEARETVAFTKEMVTVHYETPVDFALDEGAFPRYGKDEVADLVREYGFKQLADRLMALAAEGKGAGHSGDAPDSLPAVAAVAVSGAYRAVDEKNWKAFYAAWKKAKRFAFDTETDGLNPRVARLVGMSVSFAEGEGWYLPLATVTAHHDEIAARFDDAKAEKIAHNLKFDLAVLRAAGMNPAFKNFHDTMLMAYSLRPGERGLGLKTLAATRLGMVMTSFEEMRGETAAEEIAQLPLATLAAYAGADADATLRLFGVFEKELKKEGLDGIYERFEIPLVPVLMAMEEKGITLDTDYLGGVEKKFESALAAIDEKIIALAGKEFNIDSPKQLSEILFTDLKISDAGVKKTKTGISTAADSLEKLASAHEIIPFVLDHRELSKLLSTYVRVLPALADENGRVHTSYNQTIASTGRLSSSDPNMQNIPIRSELGKELRRAFVAPKGRKLVSIDYSQIELRIAAALAGERKMIDAFRDGKDIHTWTAAQIHHLPQEKITKDLRRTAKEINFGVLYGMGAFGVAERTGLSRTEAAAFIERYFALFPKLKGFLDGLVAKAEKDGYVETYFGRRRYVPELQSSNRQVRASGERQAVNMPMQGTNADVIKLAMMAAHEFLQNDKKAKGRADMLLQIHDELVFEIDEESVAELTPALMALMANVVEFPLPLAVEAKVGDNWEDTQPFSCHPRESGDPSGSGKLKDRDKKSYGKEE